MLVVLWLHAVVIYENMLVLRNHKKASLIFIHAFLCFLFLIQKASWGIFAFFLKQEHRFSLSRPLNRKILMLNEWCFRPRSCAVRLHWAGDNEIIFCYESCPWCRIDRSTCWPSAQSATTIPWTSPHWCWILIVL